MAHAQVESLRSDAREASDISRFYQPLVQVFEYDKQMLMLYRLMYMQRDKLDYKYNDVSTGNTTDDMTESVDNKRNQKGSFEVASGCNVGLTQITFSEERLSE